MSTPTSQDFLQRAQACLVGGVNSPVRAFGSVDVEPRIIHRAQGPYVWDADGMRLLDFIGSFGPLILGHAHSDVIDAVCQSAAGGTTFGATSPPEIELAERLQAAMPLLERVRFVSSGTEATMSALRLARGATGRNKVIKFAGCYHGHADAYLTDDTGSGLATLGLPGSAGVTPGAAQDTLSVAYNDLAAVQALMATDGGEVAAIVVEPVACNMGLVPPVPGFLAGLRALCDEHKSLLIFDEVITGLRLQLGGATAHFGVTPDLVTLGKIVGGGLPVGAYGGSRALMDHVAPLGPVYQAGTLSGNPVAMAAGIATFDRISKAGFYEALEQKTTRLVTQVQQAARAHGNIAYVSQMGSIFHLWFAPQQHAPPRNYADIKRADGRTFSRFFAALLRRDVLIAPSAFEVGFVSAAHSEAHLEQAGSAMAAAIAEAA